MTVRFLTIIMALSLLSACKQSDQASQSPSSNDTTSQQPTQEQSQPPASQFEPIQINAAPQGNTLYPGQTASFSVGATSKLALRFQWFHNGNPIEGATGSSLTFSIKSADDAGTYQVVVKNGTTEQSASTELQVGDLPEISRQPSNQAVYPGDSATFNVNANGSDLHYQWQKLVSGNWTDIKGATKSAYLITNADVSETGQYRAIIRNSGGTRTSQPASLSLKEPVVITKHPVSRQVILGKDASFNATASGAGSISYRWYKGNYAIYDSKKYSGTTSTTLVVKAVASADAGLYKLKAINNDNKYAFSNGATLSVAGPAKVTSQPSDLTLYTGKPGALVIAASGDQPLRYQWQKLVNGNWSNINGATSSALSVSSGEARFAGRYRCVVSNASGSDTSAEVTVTVSQAVNISASPASQSVNLGSSARFVLQASGDKLQYAWTKNGTILSNTSNVLSFASVKETDEATYGCRAYNSGGSVDCAPFTLTVNRPLTITRQPTSQNTYEGGSASFNVQASGDPAPTVQWFFGGKQVGTGNTLTLNNIRSDQAGQYSCRVSNSSGNLNCDPVTLSVSSSVKILGQPAATSANEGSALALTLSAVGENLSYDWSRNGVSLGINSPTLSFASLRSSDEGTYSCRIWNSSSSANCNAFTLSVNQSVRITTQPVSTSGFEDTSVTLSVAATGKPAPVVDWYFNGNLLRSNSPSLNLPALKMTDAGSYRCVVRNSVNSLNCNTVTLSVRERVRITKQLSNQTLNTGSTLRFDLQATGEAPLNFQCYRNGSSTAAVTGTSASSLVIPDAQTSDAGNYNCVVSNAGSRATSSASISVVDQVVTRSAELRWNAPTTRADGRTLARTEIAGYEIYMATRANGPFNSVMTTEGNQTTARVDDLTPGTYYLGITTQDTNGLESAMSSVFVLRIQ